MLRRLVAIALMVCAFSSLFLQTAGARPLDRRVVVVLVERSRIAEWRAVPALNEMLANDASALLSTRGASPGPRASIEALGAGARTNNGQALARALVPDGVPFVVSRALQNPLGAAFARDILPGRLLTPSVAIVESGPDPAPTLRAVRALLTPQDLLIVLSSFDRSGEAYLGVITITGARGSLFSPSTRRTGLVTIEDVAPTILRALHVTVPLSMTGRPIETRARQIDLLSFEQDLVHAARARSLLLHVFMLMAIAVAGAGGVQILRARPAHLVHAAAVVVTAIPLALVLEPVYGARMRPGVALALVIALAVIVALGARAIGRPAGVIGGLTAAVVLTDLAAGGPLASRSPLSYLLARGDRFYGLGNELMGVVIGGVLLAACAWPPRSKRAAITATIAALGVVSLMIAPSAGAKFGAAFTVVPAFGYVLARAAGIRAGWKLGAALAGATIVVAGIAYAADRAASTSARSHIGSIGAGSGTFSRKIDAALALFRFSIWFDAILVIAVLVVVIARRRPQVLRAPVLQAAGIAIVCAIASNDAGMIAAAITGTMMMSELLRNIHDRNHSVLDARGVLGDPEDPQRLSSAVRRRSRDDDVGA